MSDREKVVEGLKKVWNAFNNMEHELYADYVFDALELLKEQEAVEPKHNPLSPTDWFCGKCGMCISRFHDYCPSCGQAVKWDG